MPWFAEIREAAETGMSGAKLSPEKNGAGLRMAKLAHFEAGHFGGAPRSAAGGGVRNVRVLSAVYDAEVQDDRPGA